MKNQVSEFKKYSQSSSKIYKVIKYDDGSYSCNCPSWIFKRGEVRGCKHTEEHSQNEYINVNISGLNDNNRVVGVETTSQD